MKNALLVLSTMALLPACAFAVDGVVLINQSTVMAAGGFPYIISNPGSYKLSGPLTLSTTQNGNYRGSDIAIGINASQVALDLNGFSITVNNVLPLAGCCSTINHNFYAIAELGTFTQVSIKNGNITINSAQILVNPPNGFGINLSTSTSNSIEDLSISVGFGVGIGADLGKGTLLRHVRLLAYTVAFVACPSLAVENVGSPPSSGVGPGGGLGCLFINNVP